MTDSIAVDPAFENETVVPKRKSNNSFKCPGPDPKKIRIKSECCISKDEERCSSGSDEDLEQDRNVHESQTEDKVTLINQTQTDRPGSRCYICGKPKKSKEDLAKARHREEKHVPTQTETPESESPDSLSDIKFKPCCCSSKRHDSDSSCSCGSTNSGKDKKNKYKKESNDKKDTKDKKDNKEKKDKKEKDHKICKCKDKKKNKKCEHKKSKTDKSSSCNEMYEESCIADDLFAWFGYMMGCLKHALNSYCECRASR